MASAVLSSGFSRRDIVRSRSLQSDIELRDGGKMEEIRIPISSHSDIVEARLQGRTMAEQAGFKGTDLTVVYAVISEMARTIAESLIPGEIAISIPQEAGKVGIVIVARTYLAKKTQELFFTHQLRQYMDECKVFYKPGETILTMKKWVDVWTEESA